MKRIATANRAVDLFGVGKDGFKAAVPGVSDPTYMSAIFVNHLQEAIVRTIEQAGLVLSDGDYDQFVAALNVTYARLDNAAFTVSPTAPTPAQFDNSTKTATTEFLKKNSGRFVQVKSMPAGATNLTAADAGKHCYFNAAAAGASAVLPSLADVPDGCGFLVSNFSGGACTVQRAGADQIAWSGNTGSATAITLQHGEDAFVMSAGTFWIVTGTVNLSKAGSFGASLVTNGHRKLPSGDIEQWGYVTVTGAPVIKEVTFPIAFPNAMLWAGATSANGDSAATVVGTAGGSATPLTSCRFYCSSGTGGLFWRAIGK